MRIGIPRERLANEARVAATPKTVEQLLKLGFTVAIENGAGKLASFDDAAFQVGAAVDAGGGVALDVHQVALKAVGSATEEVIKTYVVQHCG